MITNLIPSSGSSHVLDPTYIRLGTVEVSENGVLTKKSDYVTADNSVDLKKFNSHDFDITNILAIGAYDVLRPVSIGKMSDLHVADNLESSLIAAEAAASSNKSE